MKRCKGAQLLEEVAHSKDSHSRPWDHLWWREIK